MEKRHENFRKGDQVLVQDKQMIVSQEGEIIVRYNINITIQLKNGGVRTVNRKYIKKI